MKAVYMLVATLTFTEGLKISPSVYSRRSLLGAAAMPFVAAMPAVAAHRPSFVEARQDEKADKMAEKLLKQTSLKELVAKSKANMEKELGRPMTEEELQELEAKIRRMLGLED